jgi:hypothetical protein
MSITKLPSMEFTFTIKIKGTDTPTIWEGTFKYRRPNRRMKSEIAKTTAMLNGGIPGIDEDTAFLHELLAYLKHTLVEHPQWWKDKDYGYEMHDDNVAVEIYKKTQEFEKEWKDQAWVIDAPAAESKAAAQEA